MITFFRIITFETAFFLNRFEALVEFLPAFFMRPDRLGKDMLGYYRGLAEGWHRS